MPTSFVNRLSLTIAASAAVIGGAAAGQPGFDVAALVRSRQDGMKAIGAATKEINDKLVRGASPAEIKPLAARIGALAAQSGRWFPAGSGPESGLKMKALPEIWTQSAQFEQQRRAFVAQAAKFAATANGPDIARTSADFNALRRQCKACHDTFTE